MSIGKNWCLDVVRWYVSRSVLRLMKSLLICTWPSTYRLPNSRLAAISRQFVGKSARKAMLGFWVHNWMNGTCFERQWTKESNKTKFDSYNVRNSVLIISHSTFRDCRVHILLSLWLIITKGRLVGRRRGPLGCCGVPKPRPRPPPDIQWHGEKARGSLPLCWRGTS